MKRKLLRDRCSTLLVPSTILMLGLSMLPCPLKAQWTLAFPPKGYSIGCFSNNDSLLYAGTFIGVDLSTDHGMTWTQQYGTLPAQGTRSLAGQGNNLYVALGYRGTSNSMGIARSTDEGYSWTRVGLGLTDTTVTSLGIIGSTVFAGTTKGGVFRSTDSGGHWGAVNHGLTSKTIYCLASSGSNLYAGTDSGLWLSTNKGDSWNSISRGLPNYSVSVLAVSGSSIIVGHFADAGPNYFSSDNGNTWRVANFNIQIPGAATYALDAFVFYGSSIFASLDDAVAIILLSTDGGQNWESVGHGASDRDDALTISGPNLVLGANAGSIWYRPLSDFNGTGSVKTNKTSSTIQISPNPTTGMIRIDNGPTNVFAVSVMNVLGETLQKLSNPISSNLTLNLTHLPRGTYFVRLESASGVVMKKVVKE